MFDPIKYKIKRDGRISQNSTTFGGIITKACGVIRDHSITNLRFLPSTLVMYLLDRCIDVLVPVLRELLELGFYGRMPFLSPTR